MRKPPAAKSPLSVVPLEDRLTPTTGIPWLDSSSLTVSFAPNGTDISGTPSSLATVLGDMPQATWQREMLRAFQTWAASANVNFGVVSDGGQAFGTPGAPQEDGRFGDIRVGARRLSNDLNDSVAGSSGYSPAGGTWSGDMLLNDKFQFGIGGSNGKYDLYSVALHEAGLTLGLKDGSVDNGSVMYAVYKQTPFTGLAAQDVTAIQGLYGARKADAYEGAGGNFSAAAAYDLGNTTTGLTADITTAGDVDFYKFTAPSLSSGVTTAKVDLQAKGLSLFTGKVTVTNSLGVVVGTGTVTDPLANDLSVPIVGYVPGATYTVKVEGAGGTVFSVGAYNLRLTYDKLLAGVVSKVVTRAPYVNYEGWSNNGALAQAQPLTAITTGNLSTFAVGGLLSSTHDTDWYKFTAPASGTLTASVWSFAGSAVLPQVKLYNSAGAEVATEVVANGGGLFIVQAKNQAAGGTYYARVVAAGGSAGLYAFGSNVGNTPPAFYNSLATGTVTEAQKVAYASLTVTQGRLTQFALSSFAGVGVEAAVRMTIFDKDGKQVFTLVSKAGEELTTGTVWLEKGNYTVVYNAATRTGVALPTLSYVVRKWERSEPIDPYPTDPTSPPPPPPGDGVITSPPTPTPPPGPIGPISNPFPL